MRSKTITLCLSLVALALSAPMNGLSPSLSLVAHEMGFNEHERDIYLGGYISLATMVGQMIGSCVSGFIVERYSRKKITSNILILGASSMILFGMIDNFSFLLLLRAITGGCQGAIVPVLFSLIGDYFSAEDRPSISAIVGSCLGGGMMIGQLLTGYFLSMVGWRIPFIVMGIFTFFVLFLVRLLLLDPVRGGKEDALSDLISKGIELPTLTIQSFIEALFVPSVFIMIGQTIPNTIPWGVLSAHLHDLLATDAHLSMREATSLIALFGFGAAIGGIFGGLLGAKLYTLYRPLLPAFMGITMAISSLLLQRLLKMDLTAPGAQTLALPVLILSGVLAAVNGANIRSLVLNLTSPEARGASIAVLNLVNCAGRGIGPVLVDIWMVHQKVGRREAVSSFLSLWLFSGTCLCLASYTIQKDEENLRLNMKKMSEKKLNENNKNNNQPQYPQISSI